MTPERIDVLRAEFERAHIGHCRFDRCVCGSYISPHAAVAWRSWRLAHAHYCEGPATEPGGEGGA